MAATSKIKVNRWGENVLFKKNSLKELGNNRYLVRTSPYQNQPYTREVLVEPGKTYVIIPCNKNALKNRNRECTFLLANGTMAEVKLSDTGRIIWVDLDDLTAPTETERIQESLELLRKKGSERTKIR